jgi:murein DD-endopeptidase MepM/ murein hydrolase activator NlpD
LPESQSRNLTHQNPKRYVESLATEVNKLRQKYQSKSAKSQAQMGSPIAANSVLPAASSEANPDFRPQPQHLDILKAELRSLQQQRRSRTMAKTQVVATETVQRLQPKLVARASVGSESYAPIVNSTVGKIVSPELPPLGKPDAYLPNGSKFAGYIWPAKGVFTSGFGWRWGRMHKGIDIAAPIGTPVVAAAPGVVVTAGWNDGGYGNLVEIEHPDGSVTLYGHNDRVLVRVGQQVAQGEQIAEMGTTGYSTGPHSHFEVHLPGQGAVNPMAYLPDSRS